MRNWVSKTCRLLKFKMKREVENGIGRGVQMTWIPEVPLPLPSSKRAFNFLGPASFSVKQK